MRWMRTLRRDTTAATAIEYAIVAGLIGLGLVGSLVMTRGSLSTVFGTTATKMASEPQSVAAGGPFSGRTVVSMTPTAYNGRAGTDYLYTFSDGSRILREVRFGAGGVITLDQFAFLEPSGGATLYRTDGSGATTFLEWDVPGPSGTVIYTASNEDAQMRTIVNGQSTYSAQSDAFKAAIAEARKDVLFFAPLLKPAPL